MSSPFDSDYRGGRVRRAVADYEYRYDRGEPLHTVVVDMVTDLLHLLAAEGYDEENEGPPAELLAVALNHFNTEVEEQAS